jgi:hypothetical protein
MADLANHSWRSLTRAERVCAGVLFATLLVWLLLPSVPQDPTYHGLADRRAFAGIPNAADVLSNLGFLVVGVVGLAQLGATDRVRFAPATEASLRCAMAGFVATAAGSAWYHLDPSNATLFWDRLPMTLIFAGVIAAALGQRVSGRLARVALVLLAGLGIAGVVHWRASGDLSLYALLQFGGFGALVLLLVVTPRGADPFPWWAVIGWYALAKLAEAADGALWNATGGLVAGHALKHLAAAMAGAVLLGPLAMRAPGGARAA